MKAINFQEMVVVREGHEWNHPMLPCCKDAIPLLEKKEKYVSWLKPKGGTDVHQQVASIKYRGKYYSLSLRMMKAIYRHVRLKRGFKNEENMDGVQGLRIPPVLLREKIRTQSRFEVSEYHHHHYYYSVYAYGFTLLCIKMRSRSFSLIF